MIQRNRLERALVVCTTAIGTLFVLAGCELRSSNDPPAGSTSSSAVGSASQTAAMDSATDESARVETEDGVLGGSSSKGSTSAGAVHASLPETSDGNASGAAVPTRLTTGEKQDIAARQDDPSKYPGGIIPASPDAKPLPGGPRLLVPERTFRMEGRPPALRVSYDDLDLLKVLNVDPVPPNAPEMFPDWLRELDGKRIRLRGFMYPAFEEMLSAFVLTRDTGVCCFGPNPKIYYLVGVKLKEGTKARYVENRPIDVVGTFHIQPLVDDEGNWYQLYKMSDAVVE